MFVGKRSRTGVLASGIVLGLAPVSARGAVIADWTFENLTTSTSAAATVGPITPEVGAGSASGVHAAATTVYSTPAGNGSVKSLSSTAWAVGDYYQFTVSTTGLVDLGLSLDASSSNTG